MATITDGKGFIFDLHSEKVILRKIPKGSTGDIIIPNNVTAIHKNSLSGSGKITSITLGDNIREISPGAFEHCKKLQKIIVSPLNPNFESDSRGVLFSKGCEWLLCTPLNLNGSYTIPDNTTHIVTGAFDSCSKLTEVKIPNSVTLIARYAFSNCENLTRVEIQKGIRICNDPIIHNCPKCVVVK